MIESNQDKGLRLACKTAYNLAQLNWSEHPTYNRKIVCSSHTARPMKENKKIFQKNAWQSKQNVINLNHKTRKEDLNEQYW